jgi:hypothetical protein
MRNEYDFSDAKIGAVLSTAGKTRITIMLDTALIEAFRERAQQAGTGYQTEINRALREFLAARASAVTLEGLTDMVRKVVREEIHAELHPA